MNFYTWVTLDQPGAVELALAALREVYSAERRFPGAGLSLRFTPPLLPSELLRHGPDHPPRLRLLELESDEWRGRVLRDEALAALEAAPLGPAARGGLVWPEDAALVALSRQLGGALGLAWQEHPDLAYAALARGGRLLWSTCLRPPHARVRYDGHDIQRAEGFDRRDAPDRVDVLREGLERLLGERLSLLPEESLTLPDALAELLLEGEAVEL